MKLLLDEFHNAYQEYIFYYHKNGEKFSDKHKCRLIGYNATIEDSDNIKKKRMSACPIKIITEKQ